MDVVDSNDCECCGRMLGLLCCAVWFQLGANNQSITSMRFRSWCINNCSDLFGGLHSLVLSRLGGDHKVFLRSFNNFFVYIKCWLISDVC